MISVSATSGPPVSGTRTGSTLIIACGAIAHELVELKDANHWEHIDIQCLPAHWHNTPELITPGVEQKIQSYKDHYEHLFVAYADCGTGGTLDTLLARYDIERLPGAHCYSFFAGSSVFDDMADSQPGTFYLTDFLLDHFDRLVIDALGLNTYPELRDQYFGNYTRLMYLRQQTQGNKSQLRTLKAQAAARALSLPLTIHDTGLEPFEKALLPVQVPIDKAMLRNIIKPDAQPAERQDPTVEIRNPSTGSQ